MIMSLPTDERARNSDAAFSPKTFELPGFGAVRRPTASVNDILSRANNLFKTGPVGMAAVGLTKDRMHCVEPLIPDPAYKGDPKKCPRIPNPDFDPRLQQAIYPKVAEAVVLLTCPRERLREIFEADHDASIKMLRSDVFDFMDTERTDDEWGGLMGALFAEFFKITQSTATIEGDAPDPFNGNGSAKKKRSPHGSRPT